MTPDIVRQSSSFPYLTTDIQREKETLKSDYNEHLKLKVERGKSCNHDSTLSLFEREPIIFAESNKSLLHEMYDSLGKNTLKK